MSDDVDIGLIVRTEGQQLAAQFQNQLTAIRAQLASLQALQAGQLRANAQQVGSLQQLVAATRKQTNALTAQTAAQQKSTQASQSAAAAIGGLLKQAIALAAAFEGFRGFKAFVDEGLEFNKTIEIANLGIASLISAQTKMTDSNGQLVEGVDKLRVAQTLATDQVNKLRIAGLQTTATTQELVVAFQQAVGVGLRWGLTLDQIRTLTIQMAQAAGALGLPMNQLNEEVRSLLSGNINPRNTRIATALGITNEQIRAAQQAGKLFDVVTSKLEAFTTAGEATAKSFSGVMSNIREAIQNLAGDATKPLFDTLKVAGQSALEEVFDLKNARISDKFAGILDVANSVFGSLGDMIADAINAGIKGAEEFSNWLSENRVQILGISTAIGDIIDELVQWEKDLGAILLPLGDMGVKLGVVKFLFETVGALVAALRTGLQGIFIVLSTIGSIILNAILLPFVAFAKIAAKVVSVFDSDMAASLDRAADSTQNFLDGIIAGVKGYVEGLAESGNALDQYQAKIIKQNETVEAQAKAQEALSSARRRAIAEENAALADADRQLREHTITQQRYNEITTEAKVTSVQKQIAAQKAYFNLLDVSDDKERRRTLALINQLKERENALKRSVVLTPNADPTKAKETASKSLAAENIAAKAVQDRDLAELKASYEKQQVATSEYFERRIQIQFTALDKMIAAEKRFRATQTDEGAIKKSLAQEKAYQDKKLEIAAKEHADEYSAEQKLAEQITQAHVQLLKDQGRLSDARALEVNEKYQKLIAQLKRNGDTDGAQIIESLFNIDNAKTRLDEIMKQAKLVQDTLSTNLSAIQTEVTTKAITERQARDKIVAAYTNARDRLKEMLPLLREQARLTGDPQQVLAVENLATKIAELDVTIKQTSDSFLKLKVAGRESLEEGLTKFIDEAGRGAKSLHDIWLEVAQDIIDALRRVAAQMLATLIIQRSLGFFRGLFGGGGGAAGAVGTLSGDVPPVVPAAQGGYISGPGTATSDSIPALLSNGEFVVRAASVRAIGRDALEQINSMGTLPSLRRPRGHRYAEGGLVTAGAGVGRGGFDMTVGLEDGLVARHLQTREGESAMINVVTKNRKTVSAILRND